MLRQPEPPDEVGHPQFLPVVEGERPQSLEHRIEWRRREQDDLAQHQRFPGSVAIEPGAAGAQREGVLALAPPHLGAGKLLVLVDDEWVVGEQADHRAPHVVLDRTAARLPAEVDVDLRDPLVERGKRPHDGVEADFLLALWCDRLPPLRPVTERMEVEPDRQR